jgi:LysM repeat protein
MNRFLSLAVVLLFLCLSVNAQQKETEKTEIIDGKKFIIHKVGEKDTLYGISRKYGVSIYSILEFNPTADAGLEIGQLIKVPFTTSVATTIERNTQTSKVIHIVKGKETLYSISRMYDVTPESIKKWNELADNTISMGQELIIYQAENGENKVVNTAIALPPDPKGRKLHQVSVGETMYSISKQYGVTIQQIKEWNNMPNYDLSNGQVLIVSEITSQKIFTEAIEPVEEKIVENLKVEEKKIVEPQTIITSEEVVALNEVKERGQAELIDGKDANRKHLAMHRTLPVGSLVKVRNEMNNREVWVKIVAKLPDTGENNKVLVKISRSAYDQLGAIDKRFLVELTYYK